jgi:ADP-heptose:LPS heptosyltransferase
LNLRFMHVVDYWLGIPLCLAATTIERLRSLVRHTAPDPPRRVLLIELSEMGSAVLAYPAIQEAVDRVGRDNVWFMIFERNREGVAVLDAIPDHHILTVSDRSFAGFLATVWRVLAQCRRARIDTAIDLELFSRCTALLAWLSGARIRSGFSAYRNEGLYRGRFFTHPVLYTPHHHMTRAYLALVRAAFVPPQDGEPLLKTPVSPVDAPLPAFRATPHQAQRVDALLTGVAPGRRIVFFNPDPGLLTLRAWPASHFAQLGRLLADAYPDVVIGVVGVARAGALAREILAGLPADRGLDLTGRTETLGELIEVLKRGAALVTIDSGPAHFSGLTDTFRVVLFGPETPQLYRPAGERVAVAYANLSCSPCFSAANHRTSSCTDNQCLKRIAPAELFEMLRAPLGATALPGR